MVNCPYLRYEPSHCASCSGWNCYAFGRKKRISDSSVCINEEEWPECPRYVQAVESAAKKGPPTPVVKGSIGILGVPKAPRPRTVKIPPQPVNDCPFFGPPPKGERTCCGIWCYAYNGPRRTGTTCQSISWRECKHRFDAARRKVKPYALGSN